ncbi:hypothetical protein QR680_012436 [Steinernema hermaphroditum]|uniref:Uncharacterized protein n=1 Tax=Steinernema hermaphroditum TaxID=289476 RepID=A0AA39LZU8_9BILA|nr:hypothetical protein QR680_012436 [Steinernema hermaphroditum]
MNSVPCNFISSVVAFMSVQNWNFDALETLNSILWSRISKLQAGKVVRFESRLLFDVDTDSWRVVFYNSRQQTFNFDELTTFSRDIVFFEEVSIGYLEDDDDKTDAEHFREVNSETINKILPYIAAQQKIDFFLLDLPDHHLNDTILWKFVDCDFSGIEINIDAPLYIAYRVLERQLKRKTLETMHFHNSCSTKEVQKALLCLLLQPQIKQISCNNALPLKFFETFIKRWLQSDGKGFDFHLQFLPKFAPSKLKSLLKCIPKDSDGGNAYAKKHPKSDKCLVIRDLSTDCHMEFLNFHAVNDSWKRKLTTDKE